MTEDTTDEKDLREVLKERLYNSTAQAMLRLFYTKNKVIAFFWLFGLLVAAGTCSYFVIYALTEYFSYGVTSNTRVFIEATSLFPKITICNLNPVTTKYAYELVNGSSYNSFMNKVNYEFDDSQKKLLTHSLEDILFECSFNLDTCDSTDFLMEYTPNYGPCYTFNSGLNSTGQTVPLKSLLRGGPSHGLILTLYTNTYYKLQDDGYFNSIGGIIIIGNSSYKTNTFGIELTPGLKTNIKVERIFEKQLSKPYSACDIDNDNPPSPQTIHSELYDLILKSPYEYNRQLCYEICTTKLVINKCNCSNSDIFSFFHNYEPCSNDRKASKCLRNFQTELNSNEFIKSNCFCPLQCNRTTYRTSISSSSLVGQYYVKNVKSNLNLSEDFLASPDAVSVRQSIVRVVVYYESLSYLETKESASNLSMLYFLGTIGGIVSLFLGINILSFFELLEAFMDIYFISKKKK